MKLKNNEEELVFAEEPVKEPGQELAPEREPVLDQRPADEEEPIAEEEKERALQTMKGKPIKNGFKIWSRCCSRGYTHQFEMYHGA
jgi:hypothetical protein